MKYIKGKESRGYRDTQEINYFAQSDTLKRDPDDLEKYRPGARIIVIPSRESPKFNSNGDNVNPYESDQVLGEGESLQGELFDHQPARISFLRADPSMKVPAMNLLAKAMLDHPSAVADYDLSEHSSKLVKRGMEMGAVNPHPRNINATITNNMDIEPYDVFIPGRLGGREIPDIEMKQAKAHLRSILRPSGRPSPLSTMQFQPQLPIFEQPPKPNGVK